MLGGIIFSSFALFVERSPFPALQKTHLNSFSFCARTRLRFGKKMQKIQKKIGLNEHQNLSFAFFMIKIPKNRRFLGAMGSKETVKPLLLVDVAERYLNSSSLSAIALDIVFLTAHFWNFRRAWTTC